MILVAACLSLLALAAPGMAWADVDARMNDLSFQNGPVVAGDAVELSALVQNINMDPISGATVTIALTGAHIDTSELPFWSSTGFGCTDTTASLLTCVQTGTLNYPATNMIDVWVVADVVNVQAIATITATGDIDAGNDVQTENVSADEWIDLDVTGSTGPSSWQLGDRETITGSIVNNGVSPSHAGQVVQIGSYHPVDVTSVTSSRGAADDCTIVREAPDTLVECELAPIASGASVTIDVEAAGNAAFTDAYAYLPSMLDRDGGNDYQQMFWDVVPDFAVAGWVGIDGTPQVVGSDNVIETGVYNDGPGRADSVQITATLPAGITTSAAQWSADNGSTWHACTVPDSSHVNCTVGSLAANTNALLHVTVAAGVDTTHEIALHASSDGTFAAMDAVLDVVTEPQHAELVVQQNGVTSSAFIGGGGSMSYTISSQGPDTAQDVVITGELPANVTIDSVTIDDFMNPQDTCPVTGSQFTCATIPTLATNEQRFVTILWTAASAGAGVARIGASSLAFGFDPTDDEQLAVITTTEPPTGGPTGRVDVAAEILTAGSGGIMFGVQNTGNATATNVTATYRLPPGRTLFGVNSYPGTYSCTHAPTDARQVTCDFGSLDQGDMAGVQLTFAGTVPFGSYAHVVDVAATEDDFNPSNNRAVDIVNAPPVTQPFAAYRSDLSIDLQRSTAKARGGDVVDLTAIVSQDGPASSVPTIRMTLPSGVLRLGMQIDGWTSQMDPFTGDCTFVASVIACKLDQLLEPGNQVQLTVQVGMLTTGLKTFGAVVENGGLEADPSNDDAQTTVDVWDTSDVDASVAVQAQSATEAVGTPVTWLIDTGVDGPASAPAHLHAVVDSQLTVSNVSEASCEPVAHVIDCDAPSTLSFDATSATPGEFGVTATVSLADADRDPDNDQARSSVVFTGTAPPSSVAADLSVEVHASRGWANVGDPINVDVDVLAETSALVPTTGLSVTMPVPSGTTFVPSGSSAGCSLGASVVSCALGRGRSSFERHLVLRFDSLTAGTREFTATVAAAMLGGGPDSDPANDSDSDSVSVHGAPSADASVSVDSVLPQAAIASVGGDDVEWSFVVRSVDGDATDVTAALAIPDGATVSSVSPSQGSCGNVDDGVIECEIGDVTDAQCSCSAPVIRLVLHVSGPGAWSVDADVTTSSADDDPTNDHVTGTSTLMDPQHVDLATTIDAPSSAEIGQTTRVAISARNEGVAIVPGTLSIELPASVHVRSIAASPVDSATCASTTGSITCSFEGAVRVVLMLDLPGSAGTVGIDAGVTATGADADSSNDAAHAEIAVLERPDADLRVQLAASPAPASVGSSVAWTSTVTNRGPSRATGLAWQLVLPAGWSSIAVTDAGGGTCAVTGQVASCTRSSLASGAQWTIVVAAVPGSAGSAHAVASIASTSSDPAAGNDTAALDLTVAAAPSPNTDLAVTITDAPDPHALGAGAIGYSVRIANAGAVTATGVAVDITLPATGAAFSGARASRGSCAAPVAGVVHCTIGGIAAGGSATIAVELVPTTLGTTGIFATASSTSPDPSSANNTRFEQTTVATAGTADLRTSVTASTAAPAIGDSVTFAVTVRNEGVITATGAVLQASIGSGLTLTGASVTSPAAACSTASGATIACPLGAIAPGATATVSVTAKAALAGTALSTFTASTTATDSVPSNDSATSTSVVPTPTTSNPTNPTPTNPTPTNPTPTVDSIAPTAKITSFTCTGKTTSRICTLKLSSADAVGVTLVEASVYRQLPKGKCMSWTGAKWVAVTCAKARATWVVIVRKSGTASKALPKTTTGQLIVRVRARDKAGNVSTLAQRVARA